MRVDRVVWAGDYTARQGRNPRQRGTTAEYAEYAEQTDRGPALALRFGPAGEDEDYGGLW